MTVAAVPTTTAAAPPVAAHEPFVGPSRQPADCDPATLSRYGDSRWVLDGLGLGGHSNGRSVNWDRFPEPLRESFRRAGWVFCNLPTPEELLDRADGRRVRWPAAASVATLIHNCRRFACWLHRRGVTCLDHVDQNILIHYARHINDLGLAANTANYALYAVSRLWGATPHLPAADRIPMPPWEATAVRDFLPPRPGSNDNSTPPIHPAVMAPLLIWAMRFVEDFADDILQGWAEYQRLQARVRSEPNPGAVAALTELVRDHDVHKCALPGVVGERAAPCLATMYIAALHDASLRQVKSLLARRRDPAVELDLRTPMDVAISGRLNGQPWMPYLNFYDAPALMRRLSTAALIVVTYLSGLRPGEAFELEVGCCHARTTSDGATRHELHGKFFKGARDGDRTRLPHGAQREQPWTTIRPVARAVEVLERMAPGRYLFPAEEPWNPATDTSRQWRTGACITSKAATKRIAKFVTWVNNFADEHGLSAADRIPTDPSGPITTSRFRRTVAWHIARLPGGRIALALQYGHLRTTVSSGYSARAQHGLRRVVDTETARAIADYLQQIDQRLTSGEGVSGPAAGRLIRSARSAARFQGMFLGKPEIRALLHEPEFQVFDNPDAFLACNKDPAKALCDPDRATRSPRDARPPSLDRCNPACANIARTDHHVAAARTEVARLRGETADPLTPLPLRARLEQRIASLTATIERHEQTRVQAAPKQQS